MALSLFGRQFQLRQPIKNILQGLGASAKLPSAQRDAAQAEMQRKAVESRLASVQPMVAPPPAVQPPTPQVPAQIPPVSPPVPPIPPPVPPTPQNPQFDAISRGLEGLKTGLEGLKTTPQVAPVPQEDEYTKALSALLKAQEKTPEEVSTEKTLGNLLASEQMGLNTIQDKPIALPFITGQQAALQRQVSTQSLPLSTRLAQLQAQRQASVDVAKTQYEIGKEKRTAEKPIEVGAGQGLVKFNSQTGKYENVFTAPEKTTGDVAEFQQIYNKKPTIEEYTQFLRSKSAASAKPMSEAAIVLQAIRDITLKEKGTVPGQIVHAASNTPVQLTDAQSQFFSMGSHLADTANEVKQIVNQIGTGAIKGWVTEGGFLIPVVQNKLDPQQQALMQKMYDMNNLFVYFSTGKQINETEFARLSKQTPNFRATPEYNASAIKQFSKMIKDRMDSYMKINGWKISGQEGGISQQQSEAGASQPQQFTLPNGTVVSLQADGTYK